MFDIETQNWVNVKAVGFYDGNNVYYFDTLLHFFKHIFQKRYRSHVIYAHNGGRFDFLPLVDVLTELKINYTLVNIGSRIAQITCFLPNKQKIVFRDSICLLPNTLKKLSEAFKVDHGKLDFDFQNEVFDLKNPKHKEYLYHDLLSLYQVLNKFFEIEKISQVGCKLTIASTALAIHRTTLKSQVRMTSDTIQRVARKSYFGGRTEIFKHEITNAKLYDFTSVYPYCMRNFKLPIEYAGLANDFSDFGFHKVSIFSPDLSVPVLPVRMCGKLIFPNGLITGWYFSEEIKTALMSGCKLVKFHTGLRFTEENDFFSEYVDFFYNLRQCNKGTALDYVAKLFLNGLYGKFSEREERRSLTTEIKEGVATEIFGSEENFNKYRLFIETKKVRSPHMLVHISSAITAYARIHLYNKILKNDETVAYCDTDSAFTKLEYPVTNILGDLKLENEVDYAFFRLPKTYIYLNKTDRIIKAKGFPSDFLKNITLDQFKNEDLKSEQLRILMLKSSIKRFNSAFNMDMLKKSIISAYDKRKTLECGIATRAWELKNGELR